MLRAGLHDWSELEQPSEASTRSMRYAACLVDRLWEGIESEGSKVLFPALPACRETNSEGSGKLSKPGSLHKSDFAWRCTKTIFHWGQVVVFPPGTLQVHHKEMDSVPPMNPPGTLQIHFEFPTQFTSDDPSWDMHSTLTVFRQALGCTGSARLWSPWS